MCWPVGVVRRIVRSAALGWRRVIERESVETITSSATWIFEETKSGAPLEGGLGMVSGRLVPLAKVVEGPQSDSDHAPAHSLCATMEQPLGSVQHPSCGRKENSTS